MLMLLPLMLVWFGQVSIDTADLCVPRLGDSPALLCGRPLQGPTHDETRGLWQSSDRAVFEFSAARRRADARLDALVREW